jgi:hypothetical protein
MVKEHDSLGPNALRKDWYILGTEEAPGEITRVGNKTILIH